MMRGILFAALALLAAAPLAAQLPPDQESEHVVKPGETLGGVAQRAKVPRILIIEANRLQAPYSLRAGQKLTIPRTRHHTVARGDTKFTVAYLYGVSWGEIATANGLAADAALRPGQRLLIPTVLGAPVAATSPSPAPSASASPATQTPALRFAWPVSGSVRRAFAPRTTANFHDGIDLTAALGTAVRASAAGKVMFAGAEPRQFGNLVVVEHTDGWQSAYAFLSQITVKEGDAVTAGERVGLSGRTGLARGPELHFEMRRNNRPVDPATQLPAR